MNVSDSSELSSPSQGRRRPVTLIDVVVVLGMLALLITLVATTWVKVKVARAHPHSATPSAPAR
jgi:hypothetical protein